MSIHPVCMVTEFALMGSLFDTLDNLTVEQLKQYQADRASFILRMPWRWSAESLTYICIYVSESRISNGVLMLLARFVVKIMELQ